MRSRRIVRWSALAVGWLVLIGVVGAGCGKTKAPPKVPPEVPMALPSEAEAQRAREESREAIPLLPEGERGMGQGDLPPADSPAVAVPDAVQAPDTHYGYRVQIFATSRQELAEQRAQEYRDILEENVYVEYEGLLYKVRVGDCLSHDEAEALRRKTLALGHEGAFIVDTQVNVQ